MKNAARCKAFKPYCAFRFNATQNPLCTMPNETICEEAQKFTELYHYYVIMVYNMPKLKSWKCKWCHNDEGLHGNGTQCARQTTGISSLAIYFVVVRQ